MSTHLPTEMEAIEASTDPAWLAGQLGFASCARLRTTPVPEPEKAAPRPAKKRAPSPLAGVPRSTETIEKMRNTFGKRSQLRRIREGKIKGRLAESTFISTGVDPDFDEDR